MVNKSTFSRFHNEYYNLQLTAQRFQQQTKLLLK